MSTAQSPHRGRVRVYKNPLLYIGLIVVGLLIIAGSLFSGAKSQLAFSYQQPTCSDQLTLLPGLMKQVEPSGYEVTFETITHLGDWPVLSRQICLSPVAPPVAGEQAIRFGVAGWSLGSQRVVLAVPEPPLAMTDSFLGKEISISQPLSIELTAPDQIHYYELEIGRESVRCEGEGQAIECDVTKLNLAQGKEYNSTLTRSFKDQPVAELAEGKVATLAPLTLKNSNLKSGQTRYDAPRKFDFEFNRPLDGEAEVKLLQLDDERQPEQNLKLSTSGSKLSVALPEDLKRETKYRLVIEQAVGDNRSTLERPLKFDFRTSGGPKVTGVSVGSAAVPTNAQIIVTFDQPLAESLDITKHARVAGASGAVSRLSAKQLAFNLDAKACAAFKLQVDKGLASGSNSAVSAEPWQFDGRTLCGTSAVIGHSVQGRPIVAHYFGSGSTTILFTGGIHGNEVSSQQTMQGWVNYLQTQAHQVIPADKQVVVVPNTNPDGIATATRNNARNVNLGRNFPTANWKADTDTPAGILKNGGGKSPGSEPETKALMNLTRQLRPRLEVSFHSQGYLVGANKVADSMRIGDIYASTVGYRTMYHDAEAIMGYSITGEYEGWMGEQLGIPAILIELPSHFGDYFPSQQAALLKMLQV